MPLTAVGSANGRSTTASINRRPGNRYRTSVHATTNPNTALIIAAITEVIDEMVDYTLSHFAFEEELMEEAGYPFCAAHKRVHEVFARRVGEMRMRFEAGEDVVGELQGMLSRWLFNHIRNDDKAYADQVKQHLNVFVREHQQGGWLKRTVHRLFG